MYYYASIIKHFAAVRIRKSVRKSRASRKIIKKKKNFSNEHTNRHYTAKRTTPLGNDTVIC